MKHLVIGLGEVGSAIREILKCEGYDPHKGDITLGSNNVSGYDMIHICFPWSNTFIEQVEKYQQRWRAKYVVVHSTVPLGTCDPHQWIHSPVRGVHPNLVEGLRTFTKYFGGVNSDVAGQVFVDLGIEAVITTKAATTEALKLWDTTQYGIMIALEKEIYAYCKRHDLPFDLVYKHANMSYNEGYTKLGKPEVVRPYLDQHDGPIGGHCVIPNAEILRDQEEVSTVMLDALLEINELCKDKE